MNMFCVKPSEIEGQGCFSNTTFSRGDRITLPVILIKKEDVKSNYTFPWDRLHKSIVLSEISYCNSSPNPNIKILAIDKIRLTKTFEFTSEVKCNDEILLEYNYGSR